VLTDRSPATIGMGVRLLALVGLAADDEEAVRLAVDVDDRSRRKAPEMTAPTSDPERALRLLSGEPSVVHPALAAGTPPMMNLQPLHHMIDLSLACREAIDAGASDLVLQHIEAFGRPTPAGRAVVAAVRGAATGDDAHWHDALAVAAAHDLRVIAIDALEGLAVGAANDGNVEVAGRLLGAAERARAETGYRWRFRFERERIEAARAAAPASSLEEGSALSWDDAIAYAQRAHGTRKRPTSGWESLTPTEEQVVALVAEGLTNPQVAEKLLMGRSTVKTHLEHVYAKLGVRNRAELAAAVARRG
jgi:DNA-binding CsgD family transcriptional regulator